MKLFKRILGGFVGVALIGAIATIAIAYTVPGAQTLQDSVGLAGAGVIVLVIAGLKLAPRVVGGVLAFLLTGGLTILVGYLAITTPSGEWNGWLQFGIVAVVLGATTTVIIAMCSNIESPNLKKKRLAKLTKIYGAAQAPARYKNRNGWDWLIDVFETILHIHLFMYTWGHFPSGGPITFGDGDFGGGGVHIDF